MELVVRAGTSKTTLHKAGRPLIVQERDAGNVPTVRYTRGRDLSGTVDGAGGIGGLLARSHGYSSGSWAYHNFYHSDGNGNVTALVNSGGTLQASYTYDPYGRYLSSTGTLLTSNVMRFSSKPWVSFLSSSATSGLYYYGYRFYDPYLQRWLNREPLEEAVGSNLYEFVHGSPIYHVDSDGRIPWPLVAAGSALCLQAATTVMQNCSTLFCDEGFCKSCCRTSALSAATCATVGAVTGGVGCLTLPYPLNAACGAAVLTADLLNMIKVARDLDRCEQSCKNLNRMSNI